MAEPSTKRQRLYAELRSHGGCTKAALARILGTLNDEGLLRHDGQGQVSKRTARRRIHDEVEAIAKQDTPFGRVIQKMPTGLAKPSSIEVVNPFAFLFVMCGLSASFWGMLNRPGHAPFKLVLYVDEICPGNPLRPDPGRMCQCLYWTFADLPANVLVQAGMWLLFTTIRTKVVELLPGGISGLMRKVMHQFFPMTGPSFSRGILMSNAGESFVLSANFAGFIADEKALKEILGLKGASGKNHAPLVQT